MHATVLSDPTSLEVIGRVKRRTPRALRPAAMTHRGTVRARAALASQSGDAAADVRSYIADYLVCFRTPTGELAVPIPAIIGSGARP
jgi:hypothetical protein